MARMLFVSAGHSSKAGRDNGALGIDGITEGARTEEFRNLFVQELKKLGVTVNVDGNNTILVETINIFKKYTNSNSILIEFHFNASSNPKATGFEVLIPTLKEATPLEKEIGNEFCNIGSIVLGIKNRGVKTEDDSARGRLGWMRLAGHNILVELGFISNEQDIKLYDSNKLLLAQKLAKYIKTKL
jgi:N-acetylmuramoyl-L-alanine amidase